MGNSTDAYARFSRCRCPECSALDRAHPGQGVQIALPLVRRPARRGTLPAKEMA